MKIILPDINRKIINDIAARNPHIKRDTIELLVGRGFNEHQINLLTSDSFLSPLNNIFTNVDKAGNLISKYLEDNNASIYIFGDYDSDGINAGVIAYDCFDKITSALGTDCTVTLYTPQRNEGYGLSMAFCEWLIENHSNDNKNILVITVDNGITKKDEVALLKANGIEVIITDHHLPQEDLIPDTLIVDAHLHDKENVNACGLCGTAVIYKIIKYLFEEIYSCYDYSDVYLPHVAIATIADMMPVTEENIILVNNGLFIMNEYTDDCSNPIRCYMQYNYSKNDKITPKDIAFGYAPELNSCGRMNDIDSAINFNIGASFIGDYDFDTLSELYCEIKQINQNRKDKTTELFNSIKEEQDRNYNPIALAIIKGHHGIAGLIANKMLETYSKPSIVLCTNDADNIISGSARSTDNVNLQQLLFDEKALVSLGGHNAAFGLSVYKDKIDELYIILCNKVLEQYSKLQIDTTEETVYVDKIIYAKDINKFTVNKYNDIMFFNSLKPPVYYLRDVQIIDTNVSSNNPNNICFTIQDSTTKYPIKVWSWNYAETYKKLGSPKKVDLVVTLDSFKGMLSIDIKCLKPSGCSNIVFNKLNLCAG